MISIVALDALDQRDLWAIRTRLTRPGSEFQAEVAAVLDGERSSCTPVAVCHLDGGLIGWACSHVWRETQTLEQYVDEQYRRSGIALALSAALVARGTIDRNRPVSVFSPATSVIVRKIGALIVHEYERQGSEWARL